MTQQPVTDSRNFTVSLFSFGYKHGTPEADVIWDVRFLPNPYWIDALKDCSGLEDDVAAYALDNETARDFFILLEPLLLFLVRQHAGGKRSRLRIGIGCTGGRHRSVAVVEYLKKFLDRSGYNLNVFHRDIEKR